MELGSDPIVYVLYVGLKRSLSIIERKKERKIYIGSGPEVHSWGRVCDTSLLCRGQSCPIGGTNQVDASSFRTSLFLTRSMQLAKWRHVVPILIPSIFCHVCSSPQLASFPSPPSLGPTPPLVPTHTHVNINNTPHVAPR